MEVIRQSGDRVKDDSNSDHVHIIIDQMDDFDPKQIQADLFKDKNEQLHVVIEAQVTHTDTADNKTVLLHKLMYHTVLMDVGREDAVRVNLYTKEDRTKQLHILAQKGTTP